MMMVEPLAGGVCMISVEESRTHRYPGPSLPARVSDGTVMFAAHGTCAGLAPDTDNVVLVRRRDTAAPEAVYARLRGGKREEDGGVIETLLFSNPVVGNTTNARCDPMPSSRTAAALHTPGSPNVLPNTLASEGDTKASHVKNMETGIPKHKLPGGLDGQTTHTVDAQNTHRKASDMGRRCEIRIHTHTHTSRLTLHSLSELFE